MPRQIVRRRGRLTYEPEPFKVPGAVLNSIMPGIAMGARRHHHILVVEDEALIALDVEELLRGAGYLVTSCLSVETALEALDGDTFDAGILDINLQGERIVPVADVLQRTKVPFIVVSGHSKEVLPERHRGRPFIVKPYDRAHLLHTLSLVLSSEKPS